jgi:hypothetical protein
MEQLNFENTSQRQGLESLDPNLQELVIRLQRLEREKEMRKKEQEATQDPKVRAQLEGEIRDKLLQITSLQKEKMLILERKFTLITGENRPAPTANIQEEDFDKALRGAGELAANDKLLVRRIREN